MINQKDKILIIGAGSIGERHIKNLISLGYSNLYILRERNLPLRTVSTDTLHIITDFNLVDEIQPKVAFICTPSAFHVSQAIQCATKGIHLFIEKPLSHNLQEIEALKQLVNKHKLYVRIGYMMRFHPLVKKLSELITANTYGKLLSFTTHWGEYLPDWHPWEDYRTSYAAKKELGGGAALTLSHDIDLVNWLVASPLQTYHTLKNYRSSLEVDVETGADFLFSYENGVTGHVHLNFYERPANRFLTFVFEEASIYFDYYQSQLIIRTAAENNRIKLDNFDRNQLFVDQSVDFFEKINNYTVADSIRNIEESEQIIHICQN